MTDWKWDYNPSEEYLTDGLPVGVIAEVERIATELAALGRDAETAGSRPEGKPGGLRNFPLLRRTRFYPVPRCPPARVRLHLQHRLERVTTCPPPFCLLEPYADEPLTTRAMSGRWVKSSLSR